MHGSHDIPYMEAALSLAERGRGTTSPNPMVGAVIVRDGRIVGRGFHQHPGGDHAEVMAIREAGENARGANMYVTLEPCNHTGRTPPCSETIITAGIKRVITAMRDPNPHVEGGGIERLQQAGIEISLGLLEERASRLNEAFVKFTVTGSPFLTLKLAMTLDGRIADRHGHSKWITGPETRKMVHRWRAWSDAVMVGSGTVLADNPRLNVRDAEGDDPLRVIVDPECAVPFDACVFADENALVITSDASDKQRRVILEDHGIEVLVLNGGPGTIPMKSVMGTLGKRQLTSILCEGGAGMAGSLIREQCVDKLLLTYAPKLIGDGLAGFNELGIEHMRDALTLDDITVETMVDDIIVTGYPRYGE